LKKRLLALAMAGSALGVLGIGLTTTAATAAPGQPCPTSGPTPAAGSTYTPPNPVDGGQAYAGGSTSGGAVGIMGPHGYIQASGSPSSATISGSSTDAPVLSGYLTVSSSPGICIAGVAA